MHHEGNILVAVMSSEKKGNNLAKTIGSELICDTFKTDKEMFVYFKDKDMAKFAEVLKSKTLGKDISPFSKKNLPKIEKEKYNISPQDMALYKEIMDEIPKEDKLSVGQITMRFIRDLDTKVTKDIDTSLTGKNYIHYIGQWDNYLKYLRKEVLCRES